MLLLVVGCNFRTAPLDLREKLALPETEQPRLLTEIGLRHGCEALFLSTCNRVELYLAGTEFTIEQVTELLAGSCRVAAAHLRPHLYEHRDGDAVHHLFRVAASLDSMIVGEGQIAGQVKRAYELAGEHGSAGPLLHALFQHARLVGKRVRSETGISRGNVSVSSAAVDYVCQVFDHFGDKTILVIGAGKMGELTLRHLRQLTPRQVLVTNRSPEKAAALAAECAGSAIPWEDLDAALARADIVLSTTGAPEPIVSRERHQRIMARRTGGPLVIIDIAVPRDFDPAIHDGEQTCLFNIDDLEKVRTQTLQERLKHLPAAEAIVRQEQQRFLKEWNRRRSGPIIARLTQDFEAMRQAILREVATRLDGRLTEEDKAVIEAEIRSRHNRFLHELITALNEETHAGGGHGVLDALRKLFRLQE